MEWREEIKRRLEAATPQGQFPTIPEMAARVELRLRADADIAKLIAAVETAEKALNDIAYGEHLTDLDAVVGEALDTLAQLQSGEFGEGK